MSFALHAHEEMTMRIKEAIWKSRRLAMLAGLMTFLTIISGCNAVIRPKMPENQATLVQAAPPSGGVGLAAVKDGRSGGSSGGVGAAGVEIQSDLGDYVHNSFANGLSHKGLPVVDTKTSPAAPGVKRTVVVTLQSASVSTIDAILQPATANVAIAVQVYDPTQKVIFAQTYTGTNRETLGLHGQAGYDENSGRIVAAAADSAVEQALADPNFQKAING
jgi:hypothetical protein